MFNDISLISQLLANQEIRIADNRFNRIILDYTFLLISDSFIKSEAKAVFSNFMESKIVIIDKYEEPDRNLYFILSFEKTIIIINQLSFHLLQELFSSNPNLNICFLSNSKDPFDKLIDITYIELKCHSELEEEILSFSLNFKLKLQSKHIIKEIWGIIHPSLFGYLIKKSYSKLNKNRMEDFLSIGINSNQKEIQKDEYITVRNVGSGSLFQVNLIYHIEEEEFLLQKIPNNMNEAEKLMKREKSNYSNFQHPFLPNFYGIVKDEGIITIEFINGQTLQNIKKLHLKDDDKMTIIFELMLAIEYLHDKFYVYRDLKPNNVMIDENKTAVLIDFDRMIFVNDNSGEQTTDLTLEYAAPEIARGKASLKSDIYSLGKMMYFIFNEKTPEDHLVSSDFEKYPAIKRMHNKCVSNVESERPSISELIFDFWINYHSMIHIDYFYEVMGKYFSNIYDKNTIILLQMIENNKDESKIPLLLQTIHLLPSSINNRMHRFDPKSNVNIGEKYYEIGVENIQNWVFPANLNKGIHYLKLASDENYLPATKLLGSIYLDSKIIPIDIDQAIHYLSIASDRNDSNSQLILGNIYREGKLIKKDLKKAVHYFQLASDNSNEGAQFNLGLIYIKGEDGHQDINKGIHYFELAAKNNYPQAQYNLGVFYSSNQYVKRDMNKAIYYLSLAANKNYILAILKMGLIYSQSQFFRHDIDKSIYYFSLGANLNDAECQFYLGFIYSNKEYNHLDINKALKYYELSSYQNHINSLINIAMIYLDGIYIKQDIDKCISYLLRASNQNSPIAQNMLGIIYAEAKYRRYDLTKAISYFELSAKQDFSLACQNIAHIYYNNMHNKEDFDKSLYYYTIAANKNLVESQYNLGLIYFDNKYIPRNIDKALYYFRKAANQNDHYAQYFLGCLYDEGKYVPKNRTIALKYFHLAAKSNEKDSLLIIGNHYLETGEIEKGIYYITQSAKNGHIYANFLYGFINQNGKYLDRNINEAIHFYKEASSFNNQYAKNNLGVIYKNGFEDKIIKNNGKAISYFEDAIHQSNDLLSMYHLAKFYFYEESTNKRNKEIVEYLVKSMNLGFPQSRELLCLFLIEQSNFDFEKIKIEIEQIKNISKEQSYLICRMIKNNYLCNDSFFKERCQFHQNNDFLYDDDYNVVLLKSVLNESKIKIKQIPEIKKEFYEGFGFDI